jgi:hypothetical protein
MSKDDPLGELLQVALGSKLPAPVRLWLTALADGAGAEDVKGEQLVKSSAAKEGGAP